MHLTCLNRVCSDWNEWENQKTKVHISFSAYLTIMRASVVMILMIISLLQIVTEIPEVEASNWCGWRHCPARHTCVYRRRWRCRSRLRFGLPGLTTENIIRQ